MLDRIDHVGIAVADLDASIAIFGGAFAMPLAHRETVTEQGVEAALRDIGENHVELLAPLGDDTPVGRFLAKRGPGLHHVAYQVTDIDETLAKLRAAGVRLIDAGNIVQTTGTTGLVVVTQIEPISMLFTLPEDDFGMVNGQMAAGPLTAAVRCG